MGEYSMDNTSSRVVYITTRKCHFTGVFFKGVLAAWAVYKLVTAWAVAT
jgi:hypothetical protein